MASHQAHVGVDPAGQTHGRVVLDQHDRVDHAKDLDTHRLGEDREDLLGRSEVIEGAPGYPGMADDEVDDPGIHAEVREYRQRAGQEAGPRSLATRPPHPAAVVRRRLRIALAFGGLARDLPSEGHADTELEAVVAYVVAKVAVIVVHTHGPMAEGCRAGLGSAMAQPLKRLPGRIGAKAARADVDAAHGRPARAASAARPAGTTCPSRRQTWSLIQRPESDSKLDQRMAW